MKSYTLSGDWLLAKEEKSSSSYIGNIPSNSQVYNLYVPHRYEQQKWKLDYAYSKAVSRYHGYVWYYKRFFAPKNPERNERVRLEFDRVSYVCEVYVNGKKAGEHKHSEERFFFDVTDLISYEKENLISLRCFEPVNGCEAIDGIRLDMIPNGFWAGSENSTNLSPIDSAGGILEDVRLTFVPTVNIEDVFVHPCAKDGSVEITLTISNSTNNNANVDVDIHIFTSKLSKEVNSLRSLLNLTIGENVFTLKTNVPNFRKWELNNPTLYQAQISLSSHSAKNVRFGFKDLRVDDDGYFTLNGKRFLLKCAHGVMSANTIIMMKANGFNAFRSIQQVMPEEVMDLCDELGFLIIESPLTSWGMRLHENSRSMIEESLCNMVKMHRNHVCVGAYYLFNELRNVKILEMGAKTLIRMREISPNSLFLLSSGRWDLSYSLGSVSNPYSTKWQTLWGLEGKENNVDTNYPSRFYAVNNIGMGDLHPYVFIPMDSVAKNWFRTVGEKGAPVFLSEFGIGTQEHAMRCYFDRIRLGSSKDSETVKEIKKVWDDLENFLDFYGMKDVFPFATDICKASDKENGRQRQMLFDLIRSNPKISGLSLTSWCCGNEGTMEGDYVIKDTVSHSMQEGLAPLKWSIFTDNSIVYANTPFSLETVLCNEDVLAPGEYKAQIKIKGKNGIVFSKDFIAVYPKDGHGNRPPLSATVFSEVLSLEEGEYFVSVRLLEGECPYGGHYSFKVHSPLQNNLPASINYLALRDTTLEFLHKNNVTCSSLNNNSVPNVVFVGEIAQPCAENLEPLLRIANNGSTVVFINPKTFDKEGAKSTLKKIAGENATCKSTVDWLYHFDSVHVRHPLFDRISDEGLLRLEDFYLLYPHLVFSHLNKPTKTICAGLRVDAGNCASSLNIGEYKWGKGKIVLNGFRVEEGLGKNPYADQLLLNFIAHYKQ